MSSNADKLRVLAEEIEFFRGTCGMDDRQIARRLGISWETYMVTVKRHPELGPVNDPQAREAKRWSELLDAIGTEKSRRRHHHKERP